MIRRRTQRAFTLIELVMVIVLLGTLAGFAAMFMVRPLQGHFDAVRRAELTDVADTALRRIGRDLRLALPNSVRVDGTGAYLEFLPTTAGGRYRGQPGASGGDPLAFAAADTRFDVLSGPLTFANGDQIVVYNLGIPGADAYEGNTAATHVRRAYDFAAGGAGPTSSVRIVSAARLPFDSPGRRFHVVPGAEQAVTYACEGVGTDAAGTGTGRLTRYRAYGFNPVQQTTGLGANAALLADRVSFCAFAYAPGATQRGGLVAMTLVLSANGDSVRLYHEVHVDNVP
jgi:MSHA biogenesis protein MshO